MSTNNLCQGQSHIQHWVIDYSQHVYLELLLKEILVLHCLPTHVQELLTLLVVGSHHIVFTDYLDNGISFRLIILKLVQYIEQTQASSFTDLDDRIIAELEEHG